MDKIYIGIDLSGPSNVKDTALCVFDGEQLKILADYDDDIAQLIEKLAGQKQVYIAIDAPLTYQDNGGYRDVDRQLRRLLNDKNFKHIGVMAPTMTKMVYLTLRGMRLKCLINQMPNTFIYETHPGANLVLSGFDYDTVRKLKHSLHDLKLLNQQLSDYLEIDIEFKNDHELMACASMISAKRASENKMIFQYQSDISLQPLFVL